MSAAVQDQSHPVDPYAIARAAKRAAEAYMATLPPEDPDIQAMRRLQLDQAMAEDSRRVKERLRRQLREQSR